MKCLVIAAIFLAVAVQSAKLPEYIKKCKKGSNNGDCVAANLQAVLDSLTKNGGEAKFKILGLTPFHVDKIDLQATPQLKVTLSDLDIFGADKMQPTGGSIDGDTLHIKIHLPLLQLLGKYDINGRILILPIQGQGTCNITLFDYELDYIAKLMVEQRNGKKYYKVASDENTVLKISNLQKMHWQFDNLFNGDPRLGPEMNRFLNENWKDVFGEVQLAMEQTAAFSIMNYFINGYFHYIPIQELFDEAK